MSLVKTIYDLLPTAGQTLALNLFGLRNRRRVKGWDRFLAEFAETERMEREEQIRYVAERLKSILSHAVGTVPRYESLKPLLSHLDGPATDVFSILKEFPAVSREEVLDSPASFRSRRPPNRRIVKTATSGTTGTPFTTWMDIDTFTATDALWWRRNVWSGYRKGEWIARLVGDPIVPLRVSRPKRPWRISRVDRRLYLSSFHLSLETAHHYVDILEQIRPPFIMGYPSSLEILAAFCIERNCIPKWRPRAVWFSSEPMYEHQSAVIARVFRAPIVGLFGTAERIVSASQCEEGSYHLSLVDGYVEGQFGRMQEAQPALLTTLMNRVMPLVRFQLGDVIHVLPDRTCPCGRTLPVMDPVVTKAEDWVETPSGRRISPSALTWAFKDLPGVRRSQVVQVDRETVEVHLDVGEEAIEPAARLLQDRLGKVFFGELKVKCLRNPAIELTKSGKTRFVVRKKYNASRMKRQIQS